MKTVSVLIIAMVLAGCQALTPVNPTGDLRGEALRVNNMLALTASQIGRAELSGYIDTDEEDRMYDLIEQAIIPVELIEVLDNNNATAEDRIRQAQHALNLIKAELLKATMKATKENTDE